MTAKRFSVMVLPRNADQMLLQFFKDKSGLVIYDGFGSFYEPEADPLTTVSSVFLDSFGSSIEGSQINEMAKLQYFINKPSGRVDLKVTVFFVDAINNLDITDNMSWINVGALPYSKMHPATAKWLPIIIKNNDHLTATVIIDQPGEHTKGKLVDFRQA